MIEQDRGTRSRSPLGGERGITLLLTLAFVAFASVAIAALVSYAQVSNGSVQAYREQRTERYAGDGAVKAAVNWARYQSMATIDAAIATGRPCLYVRTAPLGVVTVSCSPRTDAGSGSNGDAVRRLRLVACVQTDGRRSTGATCTKGVDQFLTQAGVDIANHLDRAPNVATIRWWATER